MASINKVILIGNLGKDPELKFLQSGQPVANFSIATSEKWKDKSTGETKEQTEWHNIIMFGKLAEIAGQYLKKGSSVFIEGRLQTRKWQDKTGQDRYTTEIIANEMKMLGGRGGSGGSVPFGPEGGSGEPPSAPPQQYPAAAPRSPAAPMPGPDGFDDDIPF